MSDKTKKPVGTNPLTLPWPSDPQGAISALKRGGVEAAKRVNGNKEKMQNLMDALDVIREHAKARYVKDVEARKEAKLNAVSAQARVQDKLRRQAEAKASEFEKAAKELRAKAGIEVEDKEVEQGTE